MKRLLFCSVAMIAALAVSRLPAAAAPGVTYDEIRRPIAAGEPAPPAGSFDNDVALLGKSKDGQPTAAVPGIDVKTMAVSMIPVVGGFLAGSMMHAKKKAAEQSQASYQQAANFARTATLEHITRSGSLERRENPTRIVIVRPDRGLRYDLDPSMQTYRIEHIVQATFAVSSGPSTAIIKNVNGADVPAIETTVTLRMHGTLGPCKVSTLSATILSAAGDPQPNNVEQLLPDGCSLAEGDSSPTLEPAYQLMSLPQMSGTLLFIERGSPRTIDSVDPALFEPPAGYREVQ